MKTPAQISEFNFSKAVRGYNVNEVEEHIKYLISCYNELYNAYCELDAKFKISDAQLKDLKGQEGTLTNSLMNAQKIADDLISQAATKATLINNSIRDSFEEIIAAYRGQLTLEQENLIKVQKNAIDFKNALMNGYKQHVELVNELIPYEDFADLTQKTEEELVDVAVSRAADKIKNSGVDFGSIASEKEETAEEAAEEVAE